MKTATLKTAYYWDCDECGHRNFALPISAEVSDDLLEQCYRDFFDMEEWQELPDSWRQFEMVKIPAEVTCQTCCETFAAYDDRDDVYPVDDEPDDESNDEPCDDLTNDPKSD